VVSDLCIAVLHHTLFQTFTCSFPLPLTRIQRRGAIDAISFAEQLPEVDSDSIGMLGLSQSGNVVSVLAAVDSRIKACALLVPELGGKLSTKNDESGAKFTDIKRWLTDRTVDVEAAPAEITGPLPLVGTTSAVDPKPLIVSAESFAQSMAYSGRNPASKWENMVTVVGKGPEGVSPYQSPQWSAPHVQCPVLCFIAEDDEAVNVTVCRQVTAMMRECTVIEIPGGHFGWLWWPCELMTRVLRTTTRFFQRELAPAAAAEVHGGNVISNGFPGEDFSGAWVRGEPVVNDSHGDERVGFLWHHQARL
jgi:dienelactone hydrolase